MGILKHRLASTTTYPVHSISFKVHFSIPSEKTEPISQDLNSEKKSSLFWSDLFSISFWSYQQKGLQTLGLYTSSSAAKYIVVSNVVTYMKVTFSFPFLSLLLNLCACLKEKSGSDSRRRGIKRKNSRKNVEWNFVKIKEARVKDMHATVYVRLKRNHHKMFGLLFSVLYSLAGFPRRFPYCKDHATT